MTIGSSDAGQTRQEYWLSKIVEPDRPKLPTGVFVFRIVTTAPNQTFTLPLDYSTSPEIYVQDFTVDWGDSSSNTITSWDDADKEHTYASAGTYDITMDGTCQLFYFFWRNAVDAQKVTAIISLSEDIGFRILSFEYSNLITIDSSLSNMSRVETFVSFCANCSSLTAIPPGLFDNCPNVGIFTSCFYNCTSLTAIPPGLFDNNIYAYDLRIVFMDCTGITSIPAGLFDNNISLLKLDSCFEGCTGLTAIPSGLFDYNVKIRELSYCFYGCTGINTDLPADLILNNVLIDDYVRMFKNCTSMTGDGTAFVDTAEANAAAQGITLLHSDCFENCTSLPDYALIPADWK